MRYDKLNRTKPYYDWHFKDYLTQEHVVLDRLDCSKALEKQSKRKIPSELIA